MLSEPIETQEIFWAPAKALSAKKVGVLTLFLAAGLLAYNLVTYIGLVLDNQPLRSAINAYGLFPFGFSLVRTTLGAIGMAVAWSVGLFAVMLGMTAVAFMTGEEIRGNRLVSVRQSVHVALGGAGVFWNAFLGMLLFVLFVVLLLFLFGLVTRIPFIGEWVYLLFFLLPNLVIAIFLTFILLMIGISIVLMPSVVALQKRGEAFGAIVETYASIVRRGPQWVVYTIYGAIAAKVSSFVYACFAAAAVWLLTSAIALGGGEKIVELTRAGLGKLPLHADGFQFFLTLWPLPWSGIPIDTQARAWQEGFDGVVMGIMLTLVFLSVVAYALAILTVQQTYTYVWLKWQRDGKDVSAESTIFRAKQGEL